MPTTDAVCALCDGTHWRQVEGQRGVVPCDCVKAKRQPYADGVPLEFRDARLGNYRPMPGNKTALASAKTLLAADTGDLFLAGPIGSGKSRLGCTVLNEYYLASRGSGLFIRVPKLLLDLQLMFGSDKSAEDRAEERRFCDRLFSVGLLVLDDLGVEKASDYSNRTLYTVYEERSDRGLRTIWTSNLGLGRDPKFKAHDPNRPQTLGEFLGDDRLPSRIAGRATIAYIQCADQRLPFRGRDDD
jgi:DNA replication protein DnaC